MTWQGTLAFHTIAVRNGHPRQIVQELDRYLVGQAAAKRAAAVAIRTR